MLGELHGASGQSRRDPSTLRRRRWPLALAVAVLLGGLLPGFTPAARAEDLTLRVGAVGEPNTSNVNQCCMDQMALRLTYNGLAAMQFGGGLKPEFAESWTTSPDGLTWTFKIRAGMQWSDGQPADANDAAFTFNYIVKSIGDKNEVGNGFNNTYWWKDADTGKSTIVSATAPDPLTLVVTTTVPIANFLYSNFFVLPQHVWRDVTYEQAMTKFQAEPPIVGSGPFILTEWKHGQSLRLTRNEHYWGQMPAIKDVLVVYFKSVDAEMQALQAGEIDFAPNASINSFDVLSKAPNLEVISAQTPWVTNLFFNIGAPDGVKNGRNTDATADPAFRDAIGYAIDHQAIVDKVYAGHAQPGVGLTAPIDAANYTGLTDIARTFDLTEAARRLDAAGYKLGADGVRTDSAGKPLDLRLLVYPDPPEIGTAAQFVVGWLGQLGVKVTPVAVDSGAYWDKFDARAWELAINFNQNPAGPISFVDVVMNPRYCNACWTSKEYSDLFAQYNQTFDPAQSKVLAAQLDRTFYKGASFIVLAYPDMIQAHRTDKFAGWIRTANGVGPYMVLDAFASVFPLFENLAPVGAATPSPSMAATEAPSAVASAVPSAATPAPSSSGGTSGTGDSTPLIVGVVVVLAVVVGGFWWWRRRAA